jgi:hypothetical protein
MCEINKSFKRVVPLIIISQYWLFLLIIDISFISWANLSLELLLGFELLLEYFNNIFVEQSSHIFLSIHLLILKMWIVDLVRCGVFGSRAWYSFISPAQSGRALIELATLWFHDFSTNEVQSINDWLFTQANSKLLFLSNDVGIINQNLTSDISRSRK